VLALRNAHDRLVPRASLDRLLGKLRAAHVERVELGPGDYPEGRADHFAWMKDPEPVAARLARWLTASSGAPP
jgi:predicted alpha/beta hydrolase